LRERREDIPLLFKHFVIDASEKFGRDVPTISPELLHQISAVPFPGNVRELRAIVFDAVARCDNNLLTPDHFPGLAVMPDGRCSSIHSLARNADTLIAMFGRFPTIQEMEEFMIDEAIKLTSGNQTAASVMLDISRPTLNKRLHRKD
jgi:DNA-binding NtrC family response regulator